MKEVEPELFDSIKEDLKKDFHQEQKNALDELVKSSIERKFKTADNCFDIANRAVGWMTYANYLVYGFAFTACVFALLAYAFRYSARIEMLELKLNAAS